MLSFSDNFEHKSKSKPLKSQQEINPTSGFGTKFKANQDSEKTSKQKGFYSTLFLVLGVVGLGSCAASMFFGYALLGVAMLIVGGLSMLGIPLSRHYLEPSASSTSKQESPPNPGAESQSPNLDKKLTDLLASDLPATRPIKSDRTKNNPMDIIFGEIESASGDEFSDECKPAKPSDYEGIFAFSDVDDDITRSHKVKL